MSHAAFVPVDREEKARLDALWAPHAAEWGPEWYRAVYYVASWVSRGGGLVVQVPGEESPLVLHGGLVPRWAYALTNDVRAGDEVRAVRYFLRHYGPRGTAGLYALIGRPALVALWEQLPREAKEP